MDLEEFMDIQKCFTRNFIDLDNASMDERKDYVRKILLYMDSEKDELLRSMGGWKDFLPSGFFSKSGYVEELVDIFKFFLNLALAFKISAEEIEEQFKIKSEVMNQRLQQEKILQNLNGKKVAILDLDGVLASYPESWIEFLQKRGITISIEAWIEEDMKMRFLMDPRRYFSLKHEFIESGGYRDMGILPGAILFTELLKRKGYIIVILTSRPYPTYKRVFGDTLLWLKENNIVFDAILFDENKVEAVVSRGIKPQFVVEDNLNYAKQFSSIGVKTFLLRRPYNGGFSNSIPNLQVVDSLMEVEKWIE
jgi:hypothetical protein